MSIYIKKLSINDGENIYRMLQELPANENGFINSFYGKNFDEFKKLLEANDESSKQKGIIDGWKVPQTMFWLYENETPIGIGKIRHFLTDSLISDGGNIGYSVIPSKRGKGFGKCFVSLLITESRKLGVQKLLFTIRNSNLPSIKAALSNGGVIEKTTDERHYISIDLQADKQ